MRVDDPYAELGLRPQASDEAVKAAWRRLLSRWHPDRNPSADAADRVKRFNVAYEQILQQRRSQGDADTGQARAPARSRSSTARDGGSFADDEAHAQARDAGSIRPRRVLPR